MLYSEIIKDRSLVALPSKLCAPRVFQIHRGALPAQCLEESNHSLKVALGKLAQQFQGFPFDVLNRPPSLRSLAGTIVTGKLRRSAGFGSRASSSAQCWPGAPTAPSRFAAWPSKLASLSRASKLRQRVSRPG